MRCVLTAARCRIVYIVLHAVLMQILGVSLVVIQQSGMFIANWCHINVKTSWLKPSVSSSTVSLPLPHFEINVYVMKHSNAVITHSSSFIELGWIFCLCYWITIRSHTLPVKFLYTWGTTIAPQWKHSVILPLSPSTPEAKRWRIGILPSSVHLILIWCSFSISSSNVGNLYCNLLHPLTFQRNCKYYQMDYHF